MLALVLAFIKYIAIGLNTLLGILSAALETKDKEGHVTKKGRILISLIVIFGVISAVSTHHDENEKEQEKTKQDQFLSEIKTNFEKLKTVGYADKTNVLVKCLRGEAEQDTPQGWENVRALTDLILTIDPEHQSALNYSGEYYRKWQNDCPKAVSYYDKSLGVNLNNKYAADAYVFRGICAEGEKQLESALRDYEAAFKIDKFYAAAKTRANDVRKKLGKAPIP